jgi:regulatory protein
MTERRRRDPGGSQSSGPGRSADRRRSPDPGSPADPEAVARDLVLSRLSAAPRTRAQLEAAMAGKGLPDDVRQRVLDRFTDVGLIDDAAFANAWVESRHAGRGLAKRALSHELRQRGVAAVVADEAVSALGAEQEEQTARALVARRLPSTARLEPAARVRRLAGMLARKGYSAELSFRVVREALAAEGVDEGDLPEPPHLES